MEKEYGIIYCQICLPTDHGLSWLRWCNSPLMIPEKTRAELFSVIESLNLRWQDWLVISLDLSPMPTCLVKPGKTAEIAEDIYNMMNEFIAKYSDLEDNIKIVWTECLLPEIVEEKPSAHQLGNYAGPVRVGKFLEDGDEVGIFKV